MVPMHLGIN